MLNVTATIQLDEKELQESFIRSSGPGGQNVNKVATGVQLRFDVRGSPSLPPEVKSRLLLLGGKRLTTEGVLVIEARRFRTQEQNRRDARERLLELIRQAARRPKKRRPTKPTRGARERRLSGKKRRSHLKQQRQASTDRDS